MSYETMEEGLFLDEVNEWWMNLDDPEQERIIIEAYLKVKHNDRKMDL